MSKSSFGKLLRHYRKRAGFTQEKLAEQLGAVPAGAGYTGATISYWENSVFQIRHDKRDLLVNLIKLLYQENGLHSLEEADSWLAAGDYRPLNENEIKEITPLWLKKPSPPTHNPTPPFLIPSLPPQGILGRESAVVEILNLLNIAQISGNHPPIALRGMGGIGKTTLAIAIGQALAPFFPDGVLWVSLGPKPMIRSRLEQWGRALGINLLVEPDEEACRLRLQSILYQHRVLLIIDDVWEIKDGRFFTLAGPQGRTLFTTRELPIALGLTIREQIYRVDVLNSEAALTLLTRLVPELSRNPYALVLCERLEFLPLALTLAGRMLAIEADVPMRIQQLLHELLEQRETRLNMVQSEGRLGLGEDLQTPISLQAILGMSVGRLQAVDQERFAMLSVFGGEPLTWEVKAAAHVWDCQLPQAAETVAHFVQRGLVEQRKGRYWTHALLADYAANMREKMGL